MDRIQAGIAIALPDGQIIVKNGEAERILGLKDGINIVVLPRKSSGLSAHVRLSYFRIPRGIFHQEMNVAVENYRTH